MAMTNYNKIIFFKYNFYQARKNMNMHEVVCKDVPKLNSIHDLKTFGRKKKWKKLWYMVMYNTNFQ